MKPTEIKLEKCSSELTKFYNIFCQMIDTTAHEHFNRRCAMCLSPYYHYKELVEESTSINDFCDKILENPVQCKPHKGNCEFVIIDLKHLVFRTRQKYFKVCKWCSRKDCSWCERNTEQLQTELYMLLDNNELKSKKEKIDLMYNELLNQYIQKRNSYRPKIIEIEKLIKNINDERDKAYKLFNEIVKELYKQCKLTHHILGTYEFECYTEKAFIAYFMKHNYEPNKENKINGIKILYKNAKEAYSKHNDLLCTLYTTRSSLEDLKREYAPDAELFKSCCQCRATIDWLIHKNNKTKEV